MNERCVLIYLLIIPECLYKSICLFIDCYVICLCCNMQCKTILVCPSRAIIAGRRNSILFAQIREWFQECGINVMLTRINVEQSTLIKIHRKINRCP